MLASIFIKRPARDFSAFARVSNQLVFVARMEFRLSLNIVGRLQAVNLVRGSALAPN